MALVVFPKVLLKVKIWIGLVVATLIILYILLNYKKVSIFQSML